VLFISIHQDSNYPARTGYVEERGEEEGEGYTINIPLPPGCGCEAYFQAFERVVLPAVRVSGGGREGRRGEREEGGEGYMIKIPLPPGCGCEACFQAFDRMVLPAVRVSFGRGREGVREGKASAVQSGVKITLIALPPSLPPSGLRPRTPPRLLRL